MTKFCGSRTAANVDSAAAVSLYGFMYTLVVHALSANKVLTGTMMMVTSQCEPQGADQELAVESITKMPV